MIINFSQRHRSYINYGLDTSELDNVELNLTTDYRIQNKEANDQFIKLFMSRIVFFNIFETGILRLLDSGLETTYEFQNIYHCIEKFKYCENILYDIKKATKSKKAYTDIIINTIISLKNTNDGIVISINYTYGLTNDLSKQFKTKQLSKKYQPIDIRLSNSEAINFINKLITLKMSSQGI